MADLHLDLHDMRELHGDLVRVKSTFDAAVCDSKGLASAVGQDDLEVKIRDFESSWDDRRRNISKSLGVVAGTVGTIVDTFSEVDAKLKAGLIPKSDKKGA